MHQQIHSVFVCPVCISVVVVIMIILIIQHLAYGVCLLTLDSSSLQTTETELIHNNHVNIRIDIVLVTMLLFLSVDYS